MEISKHEKHNIIIELLEKKFIKPDFISLSDVYENLIDYSKSDLSNYKILKRKIKFSHVNCLEDNYLEELNKHSGVTTLASDLPIFIKSKKLDTKTIFICAMDSLPPEPNNKNTTNPKHEQFQIWDEIGFDLKTNIGFWGPFSLINPDVINQNDPNAIFFNELQKEYNLYITDIYKLFFYKNKNNNKFSKSNSITSYKAIKNHAEILKNEIEIIKPYCIITLGNNSRNALIKLSDDNSNSIKKWNEVNDLQINNYNSDNGLHQCKIISSPHISNSANGAKSLLLKNNKYKNIIEDNKSNDTKKIAKIIINNIKEL